MINKQDMNKLCLIVATATALGACNNGGKYITPTPVSKYYDSVNYQKNFYPLISFETSDEIMLSTIQNSHRKMFFLEDADKAAFKLIIESSLTPDSLLQPSVNLVGVLKKKKVKYNYKIIYTLLDSSNNTVAEGEVIGISDEPVDTLSNNPTVPSKSNSVDAANQLINSLNDDIQSLNMDFKVIATDKDSVYVVSNKNIKVTGEDIFLVSDLSGTTLTFDTNLSGYLKENLTLLKLKVLTGNFPSKEQSVTLQK